MHRTAPHRRDPSCTHTRTGLSVSVGAACALALIAPTGAFAQADGGTVSVFASGAGIRALGLGGAFSSIADDASASVWNPAGLGFLTQGEALATHGGVGALDLSEQFASVAYPSWRWGTAALVFRRFAISGIEQRDDRNFLISDDLSDSETELAVSYARAVNPGLSLGGTVKLQRQSIGGFGDSGLGLDLGVLMHPAVVLGREGTWMDDLAVGVSIRNAVEPSVRLDEESVPDPAAFRTGFSYRVPNLPFLTGGSALVAFDVEKSKTAAVDFHTGFEVSPHPLLALRGGWNAGYLTTGTGIRYRTATIDYLFESSDVESSHLFGVSWKFGDTVEEKRLASARAEEEEFSRRLAESFRERQTERMEELLTDARNLLASGDPEAAIEALVTAETLVPEEPRIHELQVEALLAQAHAKEQASSLTEAAILYGRVLAMAPGNMDARTGDSRVRAESDRRAERSARIRGLFASALDDFTAGEFASARGTLREILSVDPNDAEAKTMLTRTETAIRVRTSSLLAQAERFMERGLLTEAGDLLEDARGLDSGASGLARLGARLARAEEQQAAAARARREESRRVASTRERADPSAADKATSEDEPKLTAVALAPKPPVLSKKKREEVEDLYQRGVTAMKDERSDDAVRYWELVWSADPGYLNVADYLKREYLLRGLETFSQGRLEDAVRLWEKALDVDPKDQKTLGYLARAREQLARSREIQGTRQ